MCVPCTYKPFDLCYPLFIAEGMYVAEREVVIDGTKDKLVADLKPLAIGLADDTPSPELVASMFATLAFIGANKDPLKLTIAENMVLEWWANTMHQMRIAMLKEAMSECHR
jgi:hypothetical protein